MLKGAPHYGVLHIGHPSLCVCCGKPYKYGHLKCSCDDLVVCKDCGITVPERSAHYIDNVWHCQACVHICASCGHQVTETMYPAFNRRGELVSVCPNCYQTATAPCANCSVQAICQIIGRGLCQRAAIPIEGGTAA